MAMEMKMNVNLKMSQKLVMTPMLQQAIKLLPLARLELAQLVKQEIIDNPVLEEILDDDADKFITSAESLFSASSNESFVRVEFSKNKFAILIPDNEGTFFTLLSRTSLNVKPVSII